MPRFFRLSKPLLSGTAPAVGALMLLAWAAPDARALPVAHLRKVKPLVEIKSGRAWKMAGERSACVFGDTIRVGERGGAQILFNNGTKLDLRARTQIEILAPPTLDKPLVVRVLGAIGEVFVRAKGPTEIRTAAGTAAVRGTQFLLALDGENTTTVSVTEGRVALFNALGNVEIGAAQRSMAVVGQAPTPPVALDASGLLQWTFELDEAPLEIEIPTPTGDTPRARALLVAHTALVQGQSARVVPLLAPFADESSSATLLGLAALRSGDIAGAQRHLNAALAADARNVAALTLLANAQLAQGEVAPALKNARRAVEIAPATASARATLAGAQFFASDFKNARVNARRAVALDPFSPLALLALGRCEAARGDLDEARQALSQAAALRDDLPGVQRELGEVFLALDALPRAEKAFKAALELKTGDAAARAGLATVYAQTGRTTQARTEFAEALASAPNSPFLRARYARFLVESGDLTGAAAQAPDFAAPASDGSVAEASGETGALMIRLSEAALLRQKLNEALSYARRAVRLLPQSAPAHYQLGRVYLEQNRGAQAESQFRLATALDPNLARARYALGLVQQLVTNGKDGSRAAGEFAAANEGGQRGGLDVQNLATPGAAERIQAAIQDPTVIRSASRSFGDWQLEGVLSERGAHEGTISLLRESARRRAVLGLEASHDQDDGVRANADSENSRFSLVYGRKFAASPSGFYFSAQWRRNEFGADFGPDSSAFSATSRATQKVTPDLVGGYVQEWNSRARTRFLLQSSRIEQGSHADIATRSGVAQMTADIAFRSQNVEIRHDQNFSPRLSLSVGGNLGRRRTTNSTFLPSPIPEAPSISVEDQRNITVADLYARADWHPGARLSLSAEWKARRVRDTLRQNTIFVPAELGPPSKPTSKLNSGTVGLPQLVVSYRLDGRSDVRYRARRRLGGIEDFGFLAPRDVFLFSDSQFPTLPFFARGDSQEAEWNRTLGDAGFLKVGAFSFAADTASNQAGELQRRARVRGLRVAYEGMAGRQTSFFVNLGFNHTRGITQIDPETFGPRQAFTGVPCFQAEVGAQFLSDAGWFVQPSLAYVGARFEPDYGVGARPRKGGFALTSVRVGKRTGLKSSVFVEISNLFDKDYSFRNADGHVQGAGRTLRLGATLRF